MKKFALCIAKRALHTAAQTALGIIGTGTYLGEVNWKMTVSAAALAALVSVLKSFAVGVPEV